MKPGQIFRKTLPFAWRKFFLGLITFALAVAALIIIALTEIVWLALVILVVLIAVHIVLWRFYGYQLKAGHVAVITEFMTDGGENVPKKGMVKYGIAKFKERGFLTRAAFFILDGLIGGAVRQLQRGVARLGALAGGNKIVRSIVSVVNLFLGIVLGSIDECCLAYILVNKDVGAFKGGAKGVAIFFKNIKALLKSGAVTTAIVIAALVGITLVIGLIAMAIFFACGVPSLGLAFFYGVIIGGAFASAVKPSFIDSLITVRMVSAYMACVPQTEVSSETYDELSQKSSKFKELNSKAMAEEQPSFAGQPA